MRNSKWLHKLQMLRTFSGPPDKFWTFFLECISDLNGVDTGLIIEKVSGPDTFKVITSHTTDKTPDALNALKKMVPETLDKYSDKKITVFSTGFFSVLIVPLQNEGDNPTVYCLLKVPAVNQQDISAVSVALSSVTDIPLNYLRQREAIHVLQHRKQLLNVLDLNLSLNTQTRFLSAAMVLCNELAAAYKCTRVSLGWRKGSYIRLKAMSQTDHFEKKMEIVQRVEAAMDEAAEQNTEIRFPVSGNEEHVYVRDHENYLQTASADRFLTLPMRHSNEVVGVCLLEKTTDSFTDADMQHIRMLLDQVSSRLHELHLRDRWVGERFADWTRKKIALVLGFEHTWIKLITIIVAAFLLFALTVPVRYRVASPMILKTDDITFLAAPFDGYISAVFAKAGESVDKGKVILALDKKDLILEEAGLLAEDTKNKREADKFRADQKLAEMRIAQSQGDQIYSRLNIVQLRLALADMKAPFSGIIIEGDQHERIGSPVKQGEVLFKMGRIEDIRVEAKVSENEIQNIHVGVTGQIALASRPNQPFDIKVQRIEPAAITETAGNVFQVVCTFEKEVPHWLRPGMTGISKIDAGKKTLFWIVSHRTFDFLRLKLWW